jgi:hypothetical protein
MKPEIPLIHPGTVVREYDQQQTSALVARWLAAFGKNRQGVNAKAFLWHIFSAGRYPCVSGQQALTEYQQQHEAEYVVLANDRILAFVTDKQPQASALRDFFVFPENLAWTMAFTHEDGWLGPYFAYHEAFTSLNEANLSKLKKLREKAEAKTKGWC